MKLFNPKNIKHIVSLLTIALLTSCATTKDLTYFQDEPLSEYHEIEFNTDIFYKPNDKLSIIVSSIDPQASRPFNLPIISEGRSEIITQGSSKMQTYLVDRNGNIQFPVIGEFKIGGLSRTEATQQLKEQLKEYLKDPIVNIRIVNFTVTILGEVRNPGTFVLEDEKISLNEALGYAGDLTIHGRRDNVLLIRENNGKKEYAQFDLTSISVLNSISYYLEQDDIIYVSPNKAKVRSSSYNQNAVVIISAVAALTSIVGLFVN
ncbi:polysaccharide biosynthesis/export family protein [Mangrovimonas cancribranchiae]|uniref:Polysaccharide biosynthesis/export family protein n=1 Tax=Mangrovimonas cancribranchiae TaxID=3080055 RepID=A0AAU6P183_9FLAO